MHILDLIMYLVIGRIIWFILDKISEGELTNEMGKLIGIVIMFIYTLIYLVAFVKDDYNWVDIFPIIFNSIHDFINNIKL